MQCIPCFALLCIAENDTFLVHTMCILHNSTNFALNTLSQKRMPCKNNRSNSDIQQRKGTTKHMHFLRLHHNWLERMSLEQSYHFPEDMLKERFQPRKSLCYSYFLFHMCECRVNKFHTWIQEQDTEVEIHNPKAQPQNRALQTRLVCCFWMLHLLPLRIAASPATRPLALSRKAQAHIYRMDHPNQ